MATSKHVKTGRIWRWVGSTASVTNGKNYEEYFYGNSTKPYVIRDNGEFMAIYNTPSWQLCRFFYNIHCIVPGERVIYPVTSHGGYITVNRKNINLDELILSGEWVECNSIGESLMGTDTAGSAPITGTTNSNSNGETKMLEIKNVTLINGKESKHFDIVELFTLIKKEEAKIADLSIIKTVSKAVTGRKDEHTQNIEKIVAILDAREE